VAERTHHVTGDYRVQGDHGDVVVAVAGDHVDGDPGDDGVDVVVVEPNIKAHKDFEIADYKKAIEISDIIVFLVGHKEFKGLKIEKEVLDFCGIFR